MKNDLDLEIGIENIIKEYQEGEIHRWRACWLISELWEKRPDARQLIMSILQNELGLGDDQIRNLIHAAQLAGALGFSESNRPPLSPSHYSRMARMIEKYKLDSGAVEEYLELAANEGLSAQKLIDEVAQAYDPDPKFMWHRALRSVARGCRRLLELAEFNGLDKRAREAARLLLDILEDLK